MSKDIQIIRQSIGRVVNMLTNRAIKVTQRGTGAYVQYDKRTGDIELVNIPYLADDSTKEFVAAVQGFLDHEVGHVLHSNSKVLKKAVAAGQRVANLANIIEDVYVERKMAETFQGSGSNLETLRGFYLEKMARPKIDAALEAGDTETALGYTTVIAFRAWGGQKIAQDFMRNPALQLLIKPVADKLGPDLIARIGKCDSSQQCLDLALLVRDKLATPPPKAADKDEKDSSSDKRTGGGESSEDTPPDPDYDETDPEAPAGDDSGSADSKPKDEEEGKDDDAKGSGDGESDDDADEEEAESSAPRESDDSGESSDAEKPGEPGDGSDPDDAGEETGKGEEPDTSGEGDGETEADKEVRIGSGMSDDDTDREMEDIGSVFDRAHDFDKEAAEALSEMAVAEARTSDYRIFSTDWDKLDVAPSGASASAIDAMMQKATEQSGVMQKSLERAVAAQARKAWNPGQRRGKIAPGALFRTSVGDERVFRTRTETRAKNTAVSLVIDCSASMHCGDRIGTAAQAAYALASVLEKIKVPCEVIGFTAEGPPEAMVKAMKRESSEGRALAYARRYILDTRIFKGFGEKLNSVTRDRIACLTERPGWLSQNIDGESIQVCASRLKMQRAERHIMIVLSDGSPACPASHHEALNSHLKQTVQDLEKSGVEVVGIGIQSPEVANFYKKHVVLHNLKDLPTTVMGEITAALLR